MILLAVAVATAAPPACADAVPVPAGARVLDVLPALASGCAAVRVDLDGDGVDDPAAVTTDPALPDVFRVVTRLSTEIHDDDDGWRTLLALRALDGEPAAWTALRAKPPGEPVLRDTLDKAAARRLEKVGAVEVCSPARLDSGGRPATLDASTLCHCSTWYWWERGERHSAQACD